MRLLVAVIFSTCLLPAQTAQELVAKNLEARGGVDKIKAIRTLRITGKAQSGPMTFQITITSMAPNLLREETTIQGMTGIEAYDGSVGWKISPFEGRKDPELMGEDELRGFVEEADFYGPLVDYQTKDNRIEYLGKDTVDGDDAYRLKVTLANGDILYYFLDPDTYLEIRVEHMRFIRGSVRESFSNYGSYKKVAGVYFPYSVEAGSTRNPEGAAKISIEKIEANVPVTPQDFKMPSVVSRPKE